MSTFPPRRFGDMRFQARLAHENNRGASPQPKALVQETLAGMDAESLNLLVRAIREAAKGSATGDVDGATSHRDRNGTDHHAN